MTPRASQTLVLGLVLSDFCMAALAWCTAFFIRFHTFMDTPLGVPPLGLYLKIIPFVLGIWFIISMTTGLMRRTGRHSSLALEMVDVVPTALIALMGLIAFSYFYEEYRYSRITLLIFGMLQPLWIILGRILTHQVFRIYRSRKKPKLMLVIARGSGLVDATNVWSKLHKQVPTTLQVILPGQDDKSQDVSFCQSRNIAYAEAPVDWTDYFGKFQAQSVIVALPQSHASFIENDLEKIVDQVPDLRILPDISRFMRLIPGIELIDGIPIISIHESPLAGFNLIAKRLLDFVGSGFGLIVLSPVLLVLAVMIKLGSKGPVLYRQVRMGLDGVQFDCLKFRSMPVDAEGETGAVWARPQDNRATPLGAFLRRSSLDELPQLINVFMGEMSLVGPRPERPVFVSKFRKEVPGYMLRHKVKTGMTGWAQVNGWRGSTSIERRIECDLFYIQNWSLWLDIKILIMTFEEVVRGKNAY